MEALPVWAYELEGTPYESKGRTPDGADCWGLVRLAFARMGWILPSYTEEYASSEEQEVVASLIEGERPKWTEIEIDDAEVGDVLLLKTVLALGTHVGVVVGRGMMLHMRFGVRAVVETYKAGFWKDRVVGAFRYEG
jgi:cell wall-associated NlpC family hydrolase